MSGSGMFLPFDLLKVRRCLWEAVAQNAGRHHYCKQLCAPMTAINETPGFGRSC